MNFNCKRKIYYMKDHDSNGRNWARYQYQDTQELVSAFFQVIHEEILFKCSILPAYSPTGFLLLQNLTKPLASCEDKAWKKKTTTTIRLERDSNRLRQFAIPVQCCTTWVIKPTLTGKWALGEFVIYPRPSCVQNYGDPSCSLVFTTVCPYLFVFLFQFNRKRIDDSDEDDDD